MKGGRAGRKGPRLFQGTGKSGPRQRVIDSRGGGEPCEQVSGGDGIQHGEGESPPGRLGGQNAGPERESR